MKTSDRDLGGGPTCHDLLSMEHCSLAQAYLLNGRYEEAIQNCHRSRGVVPESPDDCQWVQLADVYEAWCLIATGKLDDAEVVIVRQYQNLLATGPTSSRLAESLKCLANLRARQGLFEESSSNHQEALLHFVKLTGYNSYETNLMCAKVGEHYTRLDQYETAGFVCTVRWYIHN
jgi:tetratricopeptide (TPR) repeat protein